MDARWYNPDIGRFMTQDSYQGDIYTPQSLNLYSYVMNNPVNMWDPTGHVPDWVGHDHVDLTPDGTHATDLYRLQYYNGGSSSGWYLIDKITTASQIVYKYKATINRTWTYSHDHWSYKITTDEETGETNYELTSHTTGTATYGETNYYYNDVVKKASDIARENEQTIRNLAGDPPKDTDPPAVSISTLRTDGGPVQLLNPDEIILRNTGTRTTGPQKLVAGVVQSELNDIFNTKLTVDGWYGSGTAGTIKDLQKELSLPKTGVLDARPFYQLEMAYENGAKYKRSVRKTNYTRASQVQSTGYSAPTLPVDYNRNGVPDQYETYSQGTSNSLDSWLRLGTQSSGNRATQGASYSGYQYASDYRNYLTNPQGTNSVTYSEVMALTNKDKINADLSVNWKNEGMIYGIKQSALDVANIFIDNYNRGVPHWQEQRKVPLLEAEHKEPYLLNSQRTFDRGVVEGRVIFEGTSFYAGLGAGEVFNAYRAGKVLEGIGNAEGGVSKVIHNNSLNHSLH